MKRYFIIKESNFLYKVEDNKNALLHYFQLEIDSLKVRSPVMFCITVRPSDRKGYRKKLVNLFRKINKLPYYELQFTYDKKIVLKKKDESINFK